MNDFAQSLARAPNPVGSKDDDDVGEEDRVVALHPNVRGDVLSNGGGGGGGVRTTRPDLSVRSSNSCSGVVGLSSSASPLLLLLGGDASGGCCAG